MESKKNISRFIYRLKKYRTGNRFSGEYTYKINQDSELYKQIIEFYKSNKEDVEFICLNYGVKITDEEFEKKRAAYDFAQPFTKESLLYREIFEQYYPGQAKMIPDFWMPNKSWEGCNVEDPSARVLSNYGDSGK